MKTWKAIFVLTVVSSLFVGQATGPRNRVSAQTDLTQDRLAVDTLVLGDATTCRGCSLDLELVATLGSDDGPALLYDHMAENIFRDSSGGYWLWTYDIPSQLIRFSAEKDVEVIGRPGEGPREFKRIRYVFGLEDGTVGVADIGNMRFSYFSASGEFIKSQRYRGPANSFDGVRVLNDSTFLVSAIGYEGGAFGRPLHRFDRGTGRVLESYGSVPDIFNAEIAVYTSRKLATAGPGILAGHKYEYVIDILSEDGTHLHTLVRDAPWFRPVRFRDLDPLRDGPPPSLLDLIPLEDGLLLVALRRAGPKWREGYGAKSQEGYPSVRSESTVYETVLEVLDSRSGRTMVREVLPGTPLCFVAAGEQLAILDDSGVTPRIKIYKVDFKR